MKKIMLIVLCMAMLLSTVSLVSCNKDQGSQEATGGESTETTTPPAERIKLVENGKAMYTIVYPTNASPTLLNAMNVLIKKVKDLTGVALKTKSDNLRPGHTRDPEARELLFGATNYDESQELLQTLHSDEYYIKAVGKKILILSADDKYLLAAVNYYAKHFLKNNLEGSEGNYTLYFEEYHFLAEGADQVMSINGKTVDKFVIVYESQRAGYKEVADRLSETIQRFTGYALPVYADTKAEAECEILVGKTSRTVSKNAYKEGAELLTYHVLIEGGKVQIVAGGAFSARDCVDNMALTFFAGQTKQFTNGTYIEKDLRAEASKIPALSDGADLRLMTSNMLTSWWGEAMDPTIPSVALRAEIAAAMLVQYQPHAVGLQEFNSPWLKAFEYYLPIIKEEFGLDYQLLQATHEGLENLTAILYRADLLTVEASGVEVFSYWSGSYHMRNVTWAVLRLGEKQFVFANTHWAHESEEKELACAVEHAVFLNKLKQTYSCPMFSTGDYNCKPEEERMLNFLEQAEQQSLRLKAESAGVLINRISGCEQVGNIRGEGNYIDHIIGGGSYTVLRYETVTGSMIHWMSDHSPQFADVKLN